MNEQITQDKKMGKILFNIIKKYKIYLLIIVVFVILNTYFSTYPSSIIGKITDLLYDINQNKTEIMNNVFYLVGIAVLLLLLRLPWRSLCAFLSRYLEKDLKNKIFEQFLKIKLQNLQEIKNGELMAYITKDVTEIRVFFYRIISYGTRIIMTTIIGMYVMITGVSLKLTLAIIPPVLITVYLIIKIRKYVEKSFKKAQKYFTDLSEFVQESTDAIRTTKAYCGERNRLKEFIKKNKLLKQSNNVVDVHSTLLSICINICVGLCFGITLIYGSNLVHTGEITVGDLVTFNGYISLIIWPLSWLPGIIARYKRAQISCERLNKFFCLEREKIYIDNKKTMDSLKGDIKINDLSFNYASTIEVALEHINLEIKQGQTLGIMGTIGSGKTTLMNLLLKLYPVSNGKIFIGGRDINDIPVIELRKNICYITQDNFLFSTTLRDNISLFREDYDDDEIIESTKSALINDDIQEMKNGIHTIIGERGVDLSGGQKQRVVISRAFLQKSNIVIFDDTFSALDNRTEEKLLKNVRELTKDKTCIIISNRISDIKDADNIILLDSGKIVEQGTHDELVRKNGLYTKFYNQQSSKEKMEIFA